MAVRYLVTEKDGTTHLPVSGEDGKPDHRLMGAAWAALHGGYRGNKYEGPGKEEAIRKLEALYKSEGMELPSENASEVSGTGCQVPGENPKPDTRQPTPRFVWLLSDFGAGTARIGLAVTGTWVKNGEEFEITPEDLVLAAENFRKKLTGEINVDYDHASEMPEVAAGGPIPSAGRIVGIAGPEPYVDPGGASREILWGDYEPTQRARELIRSREYRYISPAINWGARDKQTGKRQGTTLTSVALTNRPFLEELPQIRLSDPSYVEAESKVEGRRSKGPSTLDIRPSTFSEGGRMSKELTLKRLEGSHHGVFDGAEQVGHITHADFCRYAEEQIGDGEAKKASEAAREELTKIFLAEKPDEDAADRLLAAGQDVGRGEASVSGRTRPYCTLSELRRAERARKAIDAAMQAGKILPVDRAVAFSVAFGDPKAFEDWIAKRPAYARLTAPAGIAGSGIEGANARQQMAELVSAKREQLKREDPHGTASMSFSDLTARATQLVRKENPELFRRYREEKQ